MAIDTTGRKEVTKFFGWSGVGIMSQNVMDAKINTLELARLKVTQTRQIQYNPMLTPVQAMVILFEKVI
jgi:hypothetical protein